jgi:UPF0042 nucleotide-binding protein
VATSELIIVTGMAGAGRTTVLRALEDAGFEAVDNLPPPLLPTVMAAREGAEEPLAVGIDGRSRHFRPEALLATLAALRGDSRLTVRLLFLDCDDDVLIQRFSETRRRHPLADRPVADAIVRERELMGPLRHAADVHLDTSRLGVHDLRRAIVERFGGDRVDKLRIEVLSFSFKSGVPREADLVFDVRFLRNPHWEPTLQPLTGLDPSVQDFIRDDARFEAFRTRLEALLEVLVPAYGEEGKSYLTIAFGCTGGKHRSVFLAELVAAWLTERGFTTGVRHREQALARPPAATAAETAS